ncbi:gamma-glutamyl-gamma-aminobutyrate hydrolase family protein [Tissierella creatinophila]|uniref:Putative glutamine amidotransferasec n=1 Tax=Tissierella creatinophila DSM 6911 TaxID=1123403 RepID=A0A1U7M962_TISCR|nr:gamma-glutamyl-gamma-aminobutyrate hydrolase family protein [Tissierella creatinophila]OLS03749.1 putative glutamine amidotransferasec [Tissierella creatinophila DSM 6911]
MKPIIGLTSQSEEIKGTKLNKLKYTYINAVEAAGAIPIVLPNLKDIEDMESILERVDGVIFTGGEDISPLLFDEEPMRDTIDISYERDRMEMALFKAAYKKGTPILGICRGLQLINVSLGGTLYQDIPSQIENSHGHMSSYDIKGGYHSISIFKNTLLFDIFKEEKIFVNSQHHQSIKDLAKGLKINSIASDGVIEGIELENHENFLLGVQFHPECMAFSDEKFLKIFSYFIKNCSK